MVLFSRLNQEIAEKLAINYETEEREMQEIEHVVLEAHFVVNELKKEDIIDKNKLEKKLAKIKDIRCRELIYALFRLSILAAPSGSFITLNADKISALLSDYGFNG